MTASKRIINLGERRAQREPVVLTDGNGHTTQLAPFLSAELSISMLQLMQMREDPKAASVALRELSEAIFGKKDAAGWMKAMSLDELYDLLKEVYDVSSGEALASLSS